MDFLKKNKDTLFVDLINCMNTSEIKLLVELFPLLDINSKKRPVTAGTQFKTALATLMEKLLSCTPHYIRCVKPNDNKRPGEIDEARVLHQIRYLGLLENVRVRRAGFAFRQEYSRFVHRYKMICKATWPTTKDEKVATEAILKSLELKNPSQEYRMGKTKVFIRNPTTLFTLESKREQRMPYIATYIQKRWRGYIARKNFERLRSSVFIQRAWRGFASKSKWNRMKAVMRIQLQYRKYKSNKWLVSVIKLFQDVKKMDLFDLGKSIKWPQHPPLLKKRKRLLVYHLEMVESWHVNQIFESSRNCQSKTKDSHI